MDAGVVTQQAAVGAERKTTRVAPASTAKGKLLQRWPRTRACARVRVNACAPERAVGVRVHVRVQLQSPAARLEADGTRKRTLLRRVGLQQRHHRRRLLRGRVLRRLRDIII